MLTLRQVGIRCTTEPPPLPLPPPSLSPRVYLKHLQVRADHQRRNSRPTVEVRKA